MTGGLQWLAIGCFVKIGREEEEEELILCVKERFNFQLDWLLGHLVYTVLLPRKVEPDGP